MSGKKKRKQKGEMIINRERVDEIYVKVTPQGGSRYMIYTTEGQKPEDSINPIPTEWSVR